MEYYSALEKNGPMPFAAPWMQLENITLSKPETERHNPDDMTFMWNLKYDTNELIFKKETESQR